MVRSCLKRAPSRRALVLLSALGAAGAGTGIAQATPVPSIQFYDGNVLNIAGVVGTGQYASYLAVDFNDGSTPADSTLVAYQYNSNVSVSGYQMIEDIVATEQPTFTVDAGYSAEYDEHFVNNFQYNGTVGTLNDDPGRYFALYTGDYDPATVNALNPQGVDFTYSDVGIDDVQTYDGSSTDGTSQFIGWIDTQSYEDFTPPTLPEIAVPEPASLLSRGAVFSCALLRRRRRAIA